MPAPDDNILPELEDTCSYAFGWRSPPLRTDARRVLVFLVGQTVVTGVFVACGSLTTFRVWTFLCLAGLVPVVALCFGAASWLSRRRLVDRVGRLARFIDVSLLAGTRGGYRDVAGARVHLDPSRVPVRHSGKLFRLCYPNVELLAENLHGEPVAMGTLKCSLPWDEELIVGTEPFFVADECGRVVLFLPSLEANHVENTTGDKLERHSIWYNLAELGDPAFYEALARPWPRNAMTMLTHGEVVDLVGWTIPVAVPNTVLDVIRAQVECVTDVWVVGASRRQGVGFLSVVPSSLARAE